MRRGFDSVRRFEFSDSLVVRGAFGRGGGIVERPGVGKWHAVPYGSEVAGMILRWCIARRTKFLIAGYHRLEACKRLGDCGCSCIHLPGSCDCRLWEIAENLHRADLTVQERSEHIAEWVSLTGEKQPAQVAPVNKGGRTVDGKPNQGGINAAVRDLGIDRTEAQRSVRIASIAPEAKQAAWSPPPHSHNGYRNSVLAPRAICQLCHPLRQSPADGGETGPT
jgi:hypothetical protein